MIGERTQRARGESSSGLLLGRRSASPILAALLLVACAVAAYVPTLTAGYIWDDDSYLTANPNLETTDGLRRIWLEPTSNPQYYPIVFTSFWIERRLWGLHPAGYHLVNVLLHGLTAVLFWRLLARLRVPGAWFAALLFAVHPVMVESVAWVTERKNVLSAAFYLAAALAWFERRRPVVIVVLFFSALLSKTVTATLPAALALVGWWRPQRASTRDLRFLALLLIPALALGSVTAWMERHHVGAHGDSWNLEPAQRILVAGRAFWFYLGKLAWPAELTFIYPRWQPDPARAIEWLAPAAAIGLIAGLWWGRHRLGRGPLVAILIFGGTLFPALGFFNVYPFRFSFVADHFQYHASLAIFALVAAAVAGLVAIDRSNGATRRASRSRVVGVAAALIALLLGSSTWRQGRIYAGEETLWQDTLAKNPGAWMAHTNLGAWLDRQGRHEEALVHHLGAVRLRPDLGGSHNNLGVALERAGRLDEAMRAYGEALRIEPGNPDFGRNLANLMSRLERWPEAELCYREVLRLRPTDGDARNNLAGMLLRLGRPQEAAVELRELLRREPDRINAWINLGQAALAAGAIREAEAAFRRALALDPASTAARDGVEAVSRTDSRARPF